MSDNPQATPGAVAPGLAGATIIETSPAPQSGAPFVSDTSGMSPSQAAALAFVDRTRATLAADPTGYGSLALRAQHKAALAHAFHNGPAPAWLAGEAQPGATQQTAAAAATHDANGQPRTTDSDVPPELAALAQPASAGQLSALVDQIAMQGVNRDIAKQAAAVCGELQLSETHSKALLDRVKSHHGAAFEYAADTSAIPLADHEVDEYVREASRLFGTTEKFEAVSLRAREFLAARGVLERFDKQGITRSALAFDPALLTLLSAAADMAGIPRGAK